MRPSLLLIGLAAGSGVHGGLISSIIQSQLDALKALIGGAGNQCPAVWSKIVPELTAMFVDPSTKQCTDDARAALRAAFHDCGTWEKTQGSTGGCDGSLILAQEYNRPENNGLQSISVKLLALQQKYNTASTPVTVADMLQIAGATAIVSCPGGPRVQTFVGRKDNSNPAPQGTLPSCKGAAAANIQNFADKGFSAADLAALLGAHSISKSSTPQPTVPAGTPQDSTPGIWDVLYYGETLKQPAAANADFVSFASDVNLANDAGFAKEMQVFVGQQQRWNAKFADAMTRLSLLGLPGGSSKLMDCTSVIPSPKRKRYEAEIEA